MISPVVRSVLGLFLVLGCSAPSLAVAQSVPVDPFGVTVSRAELDSLLAHYDRLEAEGGTRGEAREQARQEAALIRARLRDGDFSVGDQVSLEVEGEAALTGAFTVQPGPALVFPNIGRISLSGVLRSELQRHLETELARFIRDPVVRARSSIRLLVSGGVAKGGFHVVPTGTVFTEVLMVAGGPTPDAKLKQIRVERADSVIWNDWALGQAIIEGRTLDQLSIRAGDHIVVPTEEESSGFSNTVRSMAVVIGPVAVLVAALLRFF